QRNPQVLLCVLGDIEPKLMSTITRDDYTSPRNSELFWRRHCSVVALVKEEPGKNNSPLNHKRGYCANGIKQSSKATGEELPPCPQPRGIFSEGQTFYPHVLLSMVQRIYKHVFI
ncbi:uncharacterized protein EDB93DRAFT_1049762, partial [Suillus bovinus]|uniref:uncharacterized protein n=1 Tax=Suillus bovinus TaxID=48563 RepID=UPI001B86499F